MNQDAIEILTNDCKQIDKRKCKDCICVLIYIIELIVSCVLFYFTKIPLKQSSLQNSLLLSASADTLWRVCGYSSASQVDIRSPHVQSIIDTSNQYQNEIDLCQLNNFVFGSQATCNLITNQNAYNTSEYFRYLHEISQVLPDPGRTVVSTANGTMCLDETLQNQCNFTQDYICSKEFSHYALYFNPHLSITINQQLFSISEYLTVQQLFINQGFPKLVNLCKQIGKANYSFSSFQNFDRCDVDQNDQFSAIFGNKVQFPAYIQYLINWFTNFRTLFMEEAILYYKPIFYSILVALGLSYLYVLFILLLTKWIIYASSMVFPLLLLAAGAGLIVVLKRDFVTDTFQYIAYGYYSQSFYFLGGLVIVGICLCLFLGILFFLAFIAALDDKAKISNCISICKAVLQNRKLMLLSPILYICYIFIHIAAIIILIVLVLFNGSFESQFNVMTFDYMKSDFTIQTDWNKVGCLIVLAIFLIQGTFTLMSLLQYSIANVTALWYIDESKVLKKENNKEMSSGLKVAFEKLEQDAHDERSCYIAYKQAAMNTIKGMGSVFYFGVISVFILVPDLVLRLIYFIHDRLVLIKKEKQGQCVQLLKKNVRFLMNMMERESIIYSALTGTNFCNAFKHFPNAYGVNNTAVRDVNRATKSIVFSGRFFVVCVTVIVEQAIEKQILNVQPFSFKLTPVFSVVVLSIIISSMVLNIIKVSNQTLILVYNYFQRIGKESDVEHLPISFKKMIEQYNMLSAKHKFGWKQTVKCMVGEDVE